MYSLGTYYIKLFFIGTLCFFISTITFAQEANNLVPETPSLQLTKAERIWLKDHPIIRVATDPGWSPIEFQDSDGNFKGIAIDYLEIIGQLLGVQFEIVKGSSWSELIEKGKARELDMFSCITSTPDRGEYLLFTDPYLSFPAAIFTRYDAPYVGNLQELANEKVAVVNGYAFHELLQLNHPGIDLVPVNSTPIGLQMLEEGKVAAYVGNLLVASYHITTRGNISLKVAGETPYRNDLGFAARSDWPELVVILQKALDSLSAEDKREIYTNWVSLSYEHKYDIKLLLQITAAIIAIFVFTLLIIQQRQLRARKKTMLEIAHRKAEFEAVFNAMADALVLADTERNIIMVNEAFIKTFGYSRNEVISHTTKMIYADAEAYERQGEKRFSSDAQIDQTVYELIYRRKDGSIFPGETIGVKVTDATSTLTGFLGCIRDITERKLTEESLKENKETISLLLNSTMEGVCGIDAAGLCTFANHSALVLLDYKEHDLVGRPLCELIAHTRMDGSRIAAEECAINKVLTTSESTSEDDAIFWRSDGSWFNVEYRALPTINNGQSVGAVLTFLDISEKKKLIEQRLRSSQLASIGELAAGVAHEINNPISGVINYAQVLLNNQDLKSMDRDVVKRIMKEGERVAHIVRNLLSFSHKSRDEMRQHQIIDVFAEPLQLISKQLEHDGIFLDVDIADDLPSITCNLQKMGQVLLNLISNARHALNKKYPKSHPDKILKISAQQKNSDDKKTLQLLVLDHGCGISKVDLDRIFKPFFTTKVVGEGTGLGLSISHEILMEHGATLDVESVVGQFTKFVIEFSVVEDGS